VKVLLVVIDAATPRAIGPALADGRLATLRALAARGSYRDSVTIFPSITPAATTSIVTGHYPACTGIVGASWYDEGQQQVAYYGDDFWVIAREGFRTFLRDFLVGLNGDRLRAPTLFERVERAGRTAACLNYLIFKGAREHTVKMPWLLSLLPGVPRTETIKGPTVLCLGDFVATRTLRGKPLEDVGGVLHRFGMDDRSTAELLCEMAEDAAFPDFTVAYFADNDYTSHEVGPEKALPVVVAVDQALNRMFEAAGGMDRFLEDTFVVVTSDHGHCDIEKDPAEGTIYLDEELGDMKVAALGRPWANGDDVLICPNMRAAQLYLRHPTAAALGHVVSQVLHHPRVDQACWALGAGPSGAPAFAVISSRGRIDFWRGGEGGDGRGRDAHGATWGWLGDLAVLDATLDDGVLTWGEYPNAFERLAGALSAPGSGTLWLTAKPGSEFEVPGGKAHIGGGSHGALHALESMCPVIVAGPRGVALPPELRSVDLAPLCLDLLGMPTDLGVGHPR
jgi:hypothetical protein